MGVVLYTAVGGHSGKVCGFNPTFFVFVRFISLLFLLCFVCLFVFFLGGWGGGGMGVKSSLISSIP